MTDEELKVAAEEACVEFRRLELGDTTSFLATSEGVKDLIETYGADPIVLSVGMAYYSLLYHMRIQGRGPRAIELDQAADRLGRIFSGDMKL